MADGVTGGSPSMNHERAPVAIFTSSLDSGGAQRAMVMLARGLAARGHAVDFLAARAHGPFRDWLPESARLVDLASERVLPTLPGLIRYLRRERPRALISALDYVNLVAIAARRLAGVSTPVVITEQNTPSALAPLVHTRRGRHLLSGIRFGYPRADRVIAVSEGVRADLVHEIGIPDEKVDVIFHAVLGEELSARAAEPVDHPWFLPGAPPVVVAIGRLSAQKDYPTLIRAFARLRQEREARLVILGDGPLRSEIEGEIDRHGLTKDVWLAGFVDNPYAYLARASVFALSSLCEGLPTVVIEALYCGCRIVSTDCPSGPSELLDGGRHGRLVPMEDPAAFAQGLGDALDGTLPPPVPESWQPYRVEAVARRYEALLDELAPLGD